MIRVAMGACPSCGAERAATNAPCPRCGAVATGAGPALSPLASPLAELELDVPVRKAPKAAPRREPEEEVSLELAVDPREFSKPGPAERSLAVQDKRARGGDPRAASELAGPPSETSPSTPTCLPTTETR